MSKGRIIAWITTVLTFVIVFSLWSCLYIDFLNNTEYGVSRVVVEMSPEEAIHGGYADNVVIRLNEGFEPLIQLPMAECAKGVDVSFEPYTFLEFMRKDRRQWSSEVVWDEDALRGAIEALYVPGTDAYITWKDGYVTLVPENLGREINTDYLIDIILSWEDFDAPIDISPTLGISVVRASNLREEFESMQWLNDWHVTYTSGQTIDGSWAFDGIKSDMGEPDWKYAEWVLEFHYDTYGQPQTFITHDANWLRLDNVTYGFSFDAEAETAFLKEAFRTHTSYDNRRPAGHGYYDYSDTYVEISIEEQHLWHFADGVLCCESDIVTGTKDVHDTPQGIYYISEMIPGKYLRGDDYVTWVDRWMRITDSGVGLHDASWRNKFGDTIYMTDGSHGCINLPKKFAYSLYKELEVGTEVVIY